MSEIERLREALRQAYREGFDDAVNDESAQYCGGNRKGFDQCWRESKSISAHAALSAPRPSLCGHGRRRGDCDWCETLAR